MWFYLALFVVTLLVALKVLQKRSPNNYWEQYGVPSVDVSKLASSLELLLGFKDTLQMDREIYKEMGENKFCGLVEGGMPEIFVKDLDLAKLVMIKDFDHFMDRRVLFKESKSPALLKMLPTLEGHEWRGVRVSMSPTFTTGRIRRLMECFNNCGTQWVSSLKGKVDSPIDIKTSASCFAVDVIASAVFGMEAGSIQNENSVFLKHVEKLGDSSLLSIIKHGMALRFPKIFKLLNLDAMDGTAMQFFDSILSQMLKARESGEIPENDDFLQFMIEARKGVLKREGNEVLSAFEKEARLSDETVLEKNAKQYLLDDEVVKGQGFVFFFAGYHGIAMTIAYAAHTLAYYPEIQDKLREELQEKFSADGKIGYDVINELTYMEMFVSEIWRFYPITPRLGRVCVKDYENSTLGLRIPKGTYVEIPVAAIHKDPTHYSKPDEFDPEHFNTESRACRHAYAFQPFGHGPRNCIGIRFAQVEVKTAIAHLVHNFVIEPHKTSPFPIKTILVGHGVQIPGAVNIKLTPIQH